MTEWNYIQRNVINLLYLLDLLLALPSYMMNQYFEENLICSVAKKAKSGFNIYFFMGQQLKPPSSILSQAQKYLSVDTFKNGQKM